MECQEYCLRKKDAHFGALGVAAKVPIGSPYSRELAVSLQIYERCSLARAQGDFTVQPVLTSPLIPCQVFNENLFNHDAIFFSFVHIRTRAERFPL